MVSRKALLIAATATMGVVVGLLPATASAFPNNHLVGDLQRWNLGVNYDEWVLSVSVKADDTLEFLYDTADHNVVEVDEDDYNACDPTNSLHEWDTGNDYVQLPETGRYFFICGMEDHCTRGLKFAITAV